MTQPVPCRRGLLVSVEGLNGVGKTHLTDRLVKRWSTGGPLRPLLLEEFSQRPSRTSRDLERDLGRDLLGALKHASSGDAFLRAGHPMTETLLLLAIKLHDYETCRSALQHGRLVLEGRSVHSVAVYQSLILHPDHDEDALGRARDLLDLAGRWRPLPDLTILVTDHVDAAVDRAERRDDRAYTDDEHRLHRRAAVLFDRLASEDPGRIAVLDRRTVDSERAVALMDGWVRERRGTPPCLVEPWSTAAEGLPCAQTCRLAALPEGA